MAVTAPTMKSTFLQSNPEITPDFEAKARAAIETNAKIRPAAEVKFNDRPEVRIRITPRTMPKPEAIARHKLNVDFLAW